MQELGDYLRVLYPDLDPDKDYTVMDNSDGKGPFIAKWDTQIHPKPTIEELQGRLEEYTIIKDSEILERNRKAEYPPIEDQLDSIWHAMDKGDLAKAKDFYDRIKAVKTKYPKPE